MAMRLGALLALVKTEESMALFDWGVLRACCGGDLLCAGSARHAKLIALQAHKPGPALYAPRLLTMDTVFGLQLPFPKTDLVVALVAVCSFLPIIVIATRIVQGLLRLVRGKAKAQ